MSTATGFYTPGEGWLYRLDPRAKLYAAALGVVLGLMMGHPAQLALLLVVLHIMLLAGGIRVAQVGGLWWRLAWLAVMVVGFQALLTPDTAPPLLTLGFVRATRAGLLLGTVFALRISAAVFATGLLLFTTSPDRLVQGLLRLGLPYTAGLTVWLALRYLGTLAALYTTIAEAQQARGWPPDGTGPIARVRALLPTLVALIVASLRLSDGLALGLAARGMAAPYPRTTLYPLRMRPADWLALAVFTLVFAGALVIRGL